MHHVLPNVAETNAKSRALAAPAAAVGPGPAIMSKGIGRKMNRNQITATQTASWRVKSSQVAVKGRSSRQTGPQSANKILSAQK